MKGLRIVRPVTFGLLACIFLSTGLFATSLPIASARPIQATGSPGPGLCTPTICTCGVTCYCGYRCIDPCIRYGCPFTLASNVTSLAMAIGTQKGGLITAKPDQALNWTHIVNLATSVLPDLGLTASLSDTTICDAFCLPQTSTLTISASPTTPGGLYTVTVTGTSGSFYPRTVTISVTVSNAFDIVPTPIPPTAVSGSIETSTLTVSSHLGFSGIVTLATSINATGPAVSVSPSKILVPQGASNASMLSFGPLPIGNYSITVIGVSGALIGQAFFLIRITDFRLAASSTSVIVQGGSSANTNITIQSLNGFGGGVRLSAAVTPGGPKVSFDHETTAVYAGGESSALLTFLGPTGGTYSVTITGANSTLSRSTVVAFTVQDFELAASRPFAPWTLGFDGKSTITISPSLGFTGVVSLAVSVSPASGMTCSMTPSTVTGSGTSTLSCNPSIAGNYTVNIIATSGGLSHSTSTIVTAVAPHSTILGLEPLGFYGLLGGGLAAIVVGSAFAIRRRGKLTTTLGSMPSPPQSAPQVSAQEAAASSSPPSAPSALQGPTSPELPKKSGRKLLPSGLPGITLPKPILVHKVPIVLVSAGTALVVAALATISPQAGLFGGLVIPGTLLLAVGSLLLFLELNRRPVGIRRFCMHCGFQMMSTDAACARCHKQPPSGVDTGVCPNCNAVIPALAQFCKDCGAGQPPTG